MAGVIRLGHVGWDIVVVIAVWSHCVDFVLCRIFCLGSFVWDLVCWDLRLGICGLGPFDLRLGILRVGI